MVWNKIWRALATMETPFHFISSNSEQWEKIEIKTSKLLPILLKLKYEKIM